MKFVELLACQVKQRKLAQSILMKRTLFASERSQNSILHHVHIASLYYFLLKKCINILYVTLTVLVYNSKP